MDMTTKELQTLVRGHNRTQQLLIDRCRRGERIAFNQFIRKYQDTVFSHVIRMRGDHKTASRITRDAFVKAYKAFPDFEENISIEAWLFNIAEQCIQKSLRRPLSWQNVFRFLSKAPAQTSRSIPSEDKDIQEADSLLLQYLDGELKDSEATLVEERLAKDAAFQKEYESLQHVDDALRLFSQGFAPRDLCIQINAKLDEGSLREKILAVIAIFRGQIPEHLVISSPPVLSLVPTRGSEEIERKIRMLEVEERLQQDLLALLYMSQGGYEKAVEQLNEQLSHENNPAIREIIAHISHMVQYTHQPDPCGEIRRQAEARYEKAEIYKKHEKHDKAVQLFGEALELYQQIEHTEGQILTHHQLALLYKEIEKNDESNRHAREFLELYHELKITRKYEQIQELLKE